MKKITRLWLAAGWLAAWAGSANPAAANSVPDLMNYQGTLYNAAGLPLTNAILTVKFRIFDAAKGGNMIWGSRQLVTTDASGLFNVSLGETGESLGDATNMVSSLSQVFSGEMADSRWLEVEVEYVVNGRPAMAMAPRQRFLSAPYACQAGNATGSRGDFTVGDVLAVASNAYFQRAVNITDTGQETLVFHGSLADSLGLTVSQKLDVAGPLAVNGALHINGPAVFSNDVALTDAAEFDGLVTCKNGASLRGHTAAFGALRVLASHDPGKHSDSGTAVTNGFLAVRVYANDNNSDNAVTFTIYGTNFLFKAYWDSTGTDSIKYKDWTLFPVKAGTPWSISSASDNMGYTVYYRSIP